MTIPKLIALLLTATLAAGVAWGAPAPAPTQPATQASADDGPAYAISQFIPRYLRDHPQLPPLTQVLDLSITLGQVDDAFVAPRPGVPTVTRTLKELSAGPAQRYHASAIQRILERVRDSFTARKFMAVFVAPDPFEIDEQGKDLRKAGQTSLHLIITIGTVTELRTLASGERINPEQRVNNPAHERIRRQSPIQPVQEGQPGRFDLLRRDLLDDYAFWLSRHPGRRADVALSPGLEPGSVALDYLITENKPWSVFAQASNTGTRETNDWRERFGFFHNQFTGHDDILSIDYLTAGFEKTHSVLASYEAPVGDSRFLRWRVSGAWSEFTASDVGFARDTFTGEDWNAGGELIANLYQHRDLFLDLLAGARFDHTEVDNTLPGSQHGEADFFLPHAGLRLDQAAEWFTNHAALTLEWNDGSLTDVSRSEINRLGRSAPDQTWAVLQWDLSHSVYLEPLLNRKAWQNPGSGENTLSHELFLAFRGQYAFDFRLIPRAEMPIGGFYTVRGYPESAVAGDNVFIGTAEYRYHVPRAFAIEPEPRKIFGHSFRLAPQYPYGTPDWDLILRGFFDAGRSISNGGDQFSEQDATLLGTGVGFELLLKRNLSVRMDWGVALEDLPDHSVRAGSSRIHMVFTVLY